MPLSEDNKLLLKVFGLGLLFLVFFLTGCSLLGAWVPNFSNASYLCNLWYPTATSGISDPDGGCSTFYSGDTVICGGAGFVCECSGFGYTGGIYGVWSVCYPGYPVPVATVVATVFGILFFIGSLIGFGLLGRYVYRNFDRVKAAMSALNSGSTTTGSSTTHPDAGMVIIGDTKPVTGIDARTEVRSSPSVEVTASPSV